MSSPVTASSAEHVLSHLSASESVSAIIGHLQRDSAPSIMASSVSIPSHNSHLPSNEIYSTQQQQALQPQLFLMEHQQQLRSGVGVAMSESAGTISSLPPPPITTLTTPLSPPPPTTLTLRSLVSDKEAGVIIGKGGQNVADIRAETGVRAGVSKGGGGGDQRVLTMSGSTLGIAKAYSIIAKHLLSSPLASLHPPVFADCTTIKLLVSHQLMGSVIGKGGSKIKDIQEESGAKLVISKEMLPQSTERVIEVFGLIESIKIAVYNIAECILHDINRAVGTILYNPQLRLASSLTSSSLAGADGLVSNMFPIISNSSTKAVTTNCLTGGKHPKIDKISCSTSADGFTTVMSKRRGSNSTSHNINGSRTGKDAVDGMDKRKNGVPLKSFSTLDGIHFVYRAHGEDGGGSGGTTSAPRVNISTNTTDSQTQTQTLIIPADMVGCVIGKGGTFINAIRRQSCAQLRVSENVADVGSGGVGGAATAMTKDERLITICGTAVANEKALEMLHDQLEWERKRRISAALVCEDEG